MTTPQRLARARTDCPRAGGKAC